MLKHGDWLSLTTITELTSIATGYENTLKTLLKQVTHGYDNSGQ